MYNDEGKAIAVCPEVLVGLPTPREPCEIQIKDGVKYVIGISGKDYTNLFEKAAIETLKICKRESIQNAILQSRSPSCGYGKIYDGSFKSKLIDGNGYTADLLSKNGIEILTDVKYLRNQQPRRKASGYVVLIRWLQSALIPFVTTQSVGVLNPPHE